jgi:2TM domain
MYTHPLREDAYKHLKARRDFAPHALAYALVNILVWSVWAMTDTGFPWPIFVTFGWGIGIVAHAWDAFVRRPITEAEVDRELARMLR